MRVTFCGVRGSTPAPGADFVRVGGHTSCVAIARDGEAPTLLLDAGTGIQRVSALLGGGPFVGAILLGHLHWDHTCGLPFFAAADRADSVVDVRVPEQGVDAEELLRQVMTPPHFPIEPHELHGRWSFSSYGEDEFAVGGFSVIAREIPHKGGRTMGLRITDGACSIAYLSDHAPHELGPGPSGLGEYHPAALELCRSVDLLIHDAQYTDDELPTRATFGHAAAGYVSGLVRASGAARALLFHHDPRRTDDEVAALSEAVGVGAATEGLQIDLA